MAVHDADVYRVHRVVEQPEPPLLQPLALTSRCSCRACTSYRPDASPPMYLLYMVTDSGQVTVEDDPSLFLQFTVVIEDRSQIVLMSPTAFLPFQTKHSTPPSTTDWSFTRPSTFVLAYGSVEDMSVYHIIRQRTDSASKEMEENMDFVTFQCPQ